METKGSWNGKSYDVNLSDIEDTLIKESAKCEKYSSDIVMHLEYLRKMLSDKRELYVEVFKLGFYTHGIDGTNAVKIKTALQDVYRELYRRIYTIYIIKNDDECIVKLI